MNTNALVEKYGKYLPPDMLTQFRFDLSDMHFDSVEEGYRQARSTTPSPDGL